MATTPRIRPELQASPTEEQGIKYFDVSDPRSGNRMRLYDFEWLVAQRMDGMRGYDEVAAWARERLGIHPSAGDLQEFADRLGELGFFEIIDEDYTPLPPAAMQADMMSGGNGEARREERDFEERTIPRTAEPPAPSETVTIEVDEEPPPPPAPLPSALPPVAAPRRTAPMPEAPRRRSRVASALVAVVVLVVLIGGVAYMQFIGPNAAVKVSVQVASPSDVMRLYEGAAVVKKAEPQALSFGDAGKVTDVVAKDTEVKAGMPLATLDSFGKVEKELNDVKDRAAFYDKQLAAAKAKNDDAAIKAAEAKVAEKHKLMTDLEAKAAKARIVAPGSGTVSEVLVTVGAEASPGAPAIKIADKRMSADFKLAPADAAALKPGTAVQLVASDKAPAIAGRVAKAEGPVVTIELLDDATAKPGDSLRLVKSKLHNVVKIPSAAVVKRNGADVVYVLSNGEAKERKVSVIDRDGPDAHIQSGLATGDSVITSNVEALSDGKKAVAQ